MAYFSLPTLQEYVLIAQDRMHVEVYRRNTPEPCKRLQQAADVLRLESVDFSITLNELYD